MANFPAVVEVRREICVVQCQERCAAYRSGTLNLADPAASCPRTDWLHRWGCYGDCSAPPPVSVAGSPAHPASHPVPVKAKAGHLLHALWRWIKAGCPVTEKATRRARQAVCEACPHWRSAGNLGLGECQHPGCGCTRAKHWLATERCPAGKWPESARQLAFRALATWLKWRIRRALKSAKSG